MIVDAHPHIISGNWERYPASPVGGRQSTWSRDHPADFEELRRQMDLAGIDKAVIVQTSTVYGFDNSYLADSIATDPDRFAGVCCVDFAAEGAPAAIDKWVERPGIKGVRMFTAGSTLPAGQAFPVDHPSVYPAWAHLEELQIPICVGMRTVALAQLERMMTRFPKSIVVLDHMSHPKLTDGPPYREAEALFALAAFDNLWLKVTPRNVDEASEGQSTFEGFMNRIIDSFGDSRVVWGSNYPNYVGSLKELLEKCASGLSSLGDETSQRILGQNAADLYSLGK